MGLLEKVFLHIWARLEVPITEIVAHLIVTASSILSISLIEALLHAMGLDDRLVPGTTLSLSVWMFGLEVLAATGIISVGVMKALIALVRS